MQQSRGLPLKSSKVLLGLSTVLLVGAFFFPWVQLEVVPVQGRFLPELVAEQFGKGSVWHLSSYLLYGLAVWAVIVFWRVVFRYSIRWCFWDLLIAGIGVLTWTSLSYYALFSALTFQLKWGGVLAMGAWLTALLCKRFTSETVAAP